MNFDRGLKGFREQLESQSLHIILSVLGQPLFLAQLRRSSRFRAQLRASLDELFESVARSQSLATEADLAELEVQLYYLRSRIGELRQTVDLIPASELKRDEQ